MPDMLNDPDDELTAQIYEYAQTAALDIIAETLSYDPNALEIRNLDELRDILDSLADRFESYAYSNLPISPYFLMPIICDQTHDLLLYPDIARRDLFIRSFLMLLN